MVNNYILAARARGVLASDAKCDIFHTVFKLYTQITFLKPRFQCQAAGG